MINNGDMGEQHMSMRWIVAGTAALVLAAGATACTADADVAKAVKPAVADKACGNGTYDWFNIRQDWVLTGVGDVEKLGKGGGALKGSMHRLYTPETAVHTEGPTVKAKAALWSLAVRIGEVEADDAGSVDSYFTHAGRKAPALDAGGTITFPKGKRAVQIVQYAMVKQVEADFRYSCSGSGNGSANGKTTTGHAISWLGDGSGDLECSHPTGKKAGTPATDAARLACGKDSVAAKS